MNLTRLSLYYLAGYLLFAGVALMLVPAFALGLLLSNGQYGDVLPRLLGVVLFALYVRSSDQFFLVLVGIVGLGVVMTGTAYLGERGRAT